MYSRLQSSNDGIDSTLLFSNLAACAQRLQKGKSVVIDDTVGRLVERLDKFVVRSSDFLVDHGVDLGLVKLGVNNVAQFLIFFLELDGRLLELSGNALFAETTALGVFTVAFPKDDKRRRIESENGPKIQVWAPLSFALSQLTGVGLSDACQGRQKSRLQRKCSSFSS